MAASAKEGQGELVGIKNRPRLVKDGSDVQLRHGEARQGYVLFLNWSQSLVERR